MDYIFTERKARNIPLDMGYIHGKLEGALWYLEEGKHEDLEFLREHLLKFVEGYFNGKFVYRHSRDFNPIISQILHRKTDETLRDGSTKPEDIKRLIESFEKIKRETSGDY